MGPRHRAGDLSPAVALAEDFLLKRQQGADSAQWQGPSQEVCASSLEMEGKSPDAAQGHIDEEAKPVKDAEIPLPGGGIKYPDLSITVFPAEGQAEAEDELIKALLDRMDSSLYLQEIEQTVSQADQQTIFCQALPEKGRNTQLIGDEIGCWKEMKTPQQVEPSPAETSQRSLLMTSNIHKKRYQLRSQESKKLVETDRNHTKSLIGANNKTSTDTRKPLFSKHGRKYHNVSNEFADPNSRKKDAECPDDEEGSKSHRQSLQRSQNVPTGRKLQKCATSKDNFKSRGHLAHHQQSHTGQKPHYKCSQFGKRFTRRVSLKEHERIHTGEKLYECSQCGKCFNQRANLKKHERIHTGEKPYECSQCGKCFNQRANLKKHERIHTGEKRYECSQCGKCFNRRVHLKKHEGIHTGEKLYECSQCGKCFTQRFSLKRHQRIHTEEKPL
nr:zinc finger protein with KRAB and SCAN domains 1-like [Anolis sagrei ordinatus]